MANLLQDPVAPGDPAGNIGPGSEVEVAEPEVSSVALIDKGSVVVAFYWPGGFSATGRRIDRFANSLLQSLQVTGR
jgi:hypothetical protein